MCNREHTCLHLCLLSFFILLRFISTFFVRTFPTSFSLPILLSLVPYTTVVFSTTYSYLLWIFLIHFIYCKESLIKSSNSALINMKILQISGDKCNKEDKRKQQRKDAFKHQILQTCSVFTLTEHDQFRPRHILTPSCALFSSWSILDSTRIDELHRSCMFSYFYLIL